MVVTYTPSITEDDVATALRAFLIDVVPAPVEVVQGQTNRIPAPTGPRYIVFTPNGRKALSTNRNTYKPADDQREIDQSIQYGWQVNFYGEGSSDSAQVACTLLRDEYGSNFMRPLFVGVLDVSDPRQLPLVDGEMQYQERWMVEVMLQANPAIVTAQQFADIVTAITVEVDGMEVS